jgi:hypothetical protein
MSRRRVAKGRAARDRRYIAAVRRQIQLFALSPRERLFDRPYYYCDPTEVLHRGESLDDFLRAYGGAS